MDFHSCCRGRFEKIRINFNEITLSLLNIDSAQSTCGGGVEYTDCISEEEKDSPNKCPEYDTKQSDGKALVMLELHCYFSQDHSGQEW